jgi:hypothetical protein
MPQDSYPASELPTPVDVSNIWETRKCLKDLHAAAAQASEDRKDGVAALGMGVNVALMGLAVMGKVPGPTGLVLGGGLTVYGAARAAMTAPDVVVTGTNAADIYKSLAKGPAATLLARHGINLAKSIRDGLRKATIAGAVEGAGSLFAMAGAVGLIAAPTIAEKAALAAVGAVGFVAGKAIGSRIDRSGQASVEAAFSSAHDVNFDGLRTVDGPKLVSERRASLPPQLAHS